MVTQFICSYDFSVYREYIKMFGKKIGDVQPD